MKTFKTTLPLVGSVLLLLALFRLLVPSFLSGGNLLDLTQQISVNAILAFGMTLVILTGGIDLSVGALLALTGTTATFSLLQSGLGLPMPLALLAGVGLGALFGIVNGTAVSRTGLPPFIVTLATMLIARGCALRFNEGRPMSIALSKIPFWRSAMGASPACRCPSSSCWCSLLDARCCCIAPATASTSMPSGATARPRVSRVFPWPAWRRSPTSCAVRLAGVAGAIQTAQLYSAEPASGQGFELNAIAAAAVGGASFSGGTRDPVWDVIGRDHHWHPGQRP